MNKINNKCQQRILITGANGFLGQTLLSQLQASGVSLLASDLGDVCYTMNTHYRKADITKEEKVKPLLENINTVIHAAGLAHVFNADDSMHNKFHEINVIGTENVVSSAVSSGVQHFVLISSVSVYGPCTGKAYNEQKPCNPVSSYAQSKYNAELCATKIAQKSGMALTIFRLTTLYGEGDPGNVGRLIKMIDNGRFFWVGNGSNRKSLLYKVDAARAVMAVIQRPASDINIYNISAPPCTMNEIVNVIGDVLDKHPFPLRIPASLALLLGRYFYKISNRRLGGHYKTLKKWLTEDVYDVSRFQKAYNFRTQTSLQEGLKREITRYLQEKNAR
ncbi:MAG: hypothetical protein CVU51_00705 [Deltaproteobacteria bacterium HGW-Deltaproteobacteria-1]|jgi:nucleoside-diphosphate-sugar epimerase|nr:MAG: hypothetical protein CVU51_00705 [Deltaproteobacteria bacterium HGW-Deltaproteobacteria-1]